MIPIRSYRPPQAPSAYAQGDPYNPFGLPPPTTNGAGTEVLPAQTKPLVPPAPPTTSMDQPPRRKRASKPKVKTGCKTCKIRHVKCDEAKPACHRCTSTGRKCDGYENPTQDVTNTVVSEPGPSAYHSAGYGGSVTLPNSMTVAFVGTVQERRVFHRFQVFTIPALAGGSELDFWQSLVLKAGIQEPVIRNAVIALGTLHEDYQARGGRYDANLIHEPGYQKSLQLYGRALRQLNEQLATAEGNSPRLAIISSILFTCFETLRRNDMTAIVHYRAGMRELMRQMSLRQSQSASNTLADEDRPNQTLVRQIPQDELDIMLRVFARYDVQACTFAKPRAEPLTTEVPLSPPANLNLKEVRHQLDNLLIAAYQLIKSDNGMYRYWNVADVPMDWQIHVQKALETFQGWHEALETFFNNSGLNLQPAEAKSLLGLRLQIKVAIIMLKTSVNSGPESTFDQFRNEFEGMVSSVERVTQSLALIDADPLDKESTPFTMELGIVYPLFFIASKCRESRLRRRAIAQLRKAGKEGVWEGPIMAVVAKRMMQVEEKGLIVSGQRVPERNRIHKVQKIVDYDNRQVMVEMTLAQDETWKRWEVIREPIPF